MISEEHEKTIDLQDQMIAEYRDNMDALTHELNAMKSTQAGKDKKLSDLLLQLTVIINFFPFFFQIYIYFTMRFVSEIEERLSNHCAFYVSICFTGSCKTKRN